MYHTNIHITLLNTTYLPGPPHNLMGHNRPPKSKVAQQRYCQAHSKSFYLAGTFHWFSRYLSFAKYFLMVQYCIISLIWVVKCLNVAIGVNLTWYEDSSICKKCEFQAFWQVHFNTIIVLTGTNSDCGGLKSSYMYLRICQYNSHRK